MKICVIGAGSWGTAMADHLAGLGNRVSLWARESEVVEGIRVERRNPLYLRDLRLSDGIAASTDIEEALYGAETVVMAVPSRWCREMAGEAARFVESGVPVVNLAKGFDYGSGKRLSEIIGEALGEPSRIAALSGPNHAEEVARRVPSATVLASSEPPLSRRLQGVFSSPYFRVYTNSDLPGVEVGGAYKNVVAIAAGVLDGLGLGDNTKASLITRGLAEMARFGSMFGANPITFSGLSGIGDLIVTCISRHSRNRAFGERLGMGEPAEGIMQSTNMVVEGVYATRAVLKMAAGVDIPIADSVGQVIEGSARPADMVDRLMTRTLKEESEESLYRDFLLK
jgi:glycerol-3-phosphate dehydrogenase (NAD(P)+)